MIKDYIKKLKVKTSVDKWSYWQDLLKMKMCQEKVLLNKFDRVAY